MLLFYETYDCKCTVLFIVGGLINVFVFATLNPDETVQKKKFYYKFANRS